MSERYFLDGGIRYLLGADDRLAAWLESRLPGFYLRDDAVLIGSEAGGQITGVVAFDTFSRNDCHLSVAGAGRPFWIRPTGLLYALSYPFDHRGLDRVTVLVRPSNSRAIRFARRVGFICEGVMRRGCEDGEDLAIYGLLKGECPLFKHGAKPPFAL